MEIISVSIDKGTLDELERIKGQLGFRSRSRLMRAGMESLLNEFRVLEGAKGHCDAVLTVTHRHDGSGLGDIMGRHESIIRTEIHQHHAGTCLRILIACGEAKELRNLFLDLKKEKGVRLVSCSLL